MTSFNILLKWIQCWSQLKGFFLFLFLSLFLSPDFYLVCTHIHSILFIFNLFKLYLLEKKRKKFKLKTLCFGIVFFETLTNFFYKRFTWQFIQRILMLINRFDCNLAFQWQFKRFSYFFMSFFAKFSFKLWWQPERNTILMNVF